MATTQTIKEHLTAIRETLQATSKQRDEEVKTKINSAVDHAKRAASEMQARIASNNEKAGAHYEEALKQVEHIVQDGKKAMTEAGETLQGRVKSMTESAKRALSTTEKV
ncbi:MAG TPA: hypothetical protein VGZ02_06500 [Candidatus Baltobacteraceae bacterium]|jgi:ElaB/YqjD/DUF883 family membrane-anchored ribosome-binding protein|nr:hypothetical protein [Candidatus Baltobacteraceae bacterium]